MRVIEPVSEDTPVSEAGRSWLLDRRPRRARLSLHFLADVLRLFLGALAPANRTQSPSSPAGAEHARLV